MSDASVRSGLAGLPPSNLLAGNTFNPTAGTTTAHPTGFPPGTPVVQSLLVDKTVIPGQADDIDTSSIIGPHHRASRLGQPRPDPVNGVITLTTEQWDVVTGGSGGLSLDTAYYLSAAIEGRLTDVAPSGGGEAHRARGRLAVPHRPPDQAMRAYPHQRRLT
jgi:hypothetical protein